MKKIILISAFLVAGMLSAQTAVKLIYTGQDIFVNVGCPKCHTILDIESLNSKATPLDSITVFPHFNTLALKWLKGESVNGHKHWYKPLASQEELSTLADWLIEVQKSPKK